MFTLVKYFTQTNKINILAENILLQIKSKITIYAMNDK